MLVLPCGGSNLVCTNSESSGESAWLSYVSFGKGGHIYIYNKEIKTRKSYIFKPILGQLCKEMEEPKHSKPGDPQYHLLHCLYIHHTKHKDKLVEKEVPKLVL